MFAVTVTRRYTTYENSIVRYDMVYDKVLVSQCSQINNWDWYRGLIQDVFYSLRPAAKKKTILVVCTEEDRMWLKGCR